MTIYASRFEPGSRPLTAVVDEGGALTHLLFAHQPVPAGAVWDDERCAPAVGQLREYFAGDRTAFDVRMQPAGSPFQRRVWDALRQIPFGQTVSYGELAARLGVPGRARAVGRANATNPIPIIVPCHRVIGADHSLTGYAGGMEMKVSLLRLEGVPVADGARPRVGTTSAP
ncbi:MAG TPA: methylated-DNA--[protein]-cysteine S-methyltransferase [Longimicrobium sp.]|jgi:methylated-DNA-[protein]-cysteine S-methyltransferase|uniref:methylated-DNA--[protein]-cysteine S-methyltransferase n=1 Tax=Longimicrobium sp. TaxID=2029185 RepID=UPI002ED7AF40